jgi:hypothetical protein
MRKKFWSLSVGLIWNPENKKRSVQQFVSGLNHLFLIGMIILMYVVVWLVQIEPLSHSITFNPNKVKVASPEILE